jgi:hypothetical protein
MVKCRLPSKILRRSGMGICLQLVTSKFWSLLHDSIITKIPSAGMVVSADIDYDGLNRDRTGEFGRSNSEGFQFLTTPDERSGVVADTSVVEDKDLEWRY